MAEQAKLCQHGLGLFRLRGLNDSFTSKDAVDAGKACKKWADYLSARKAPVAPLREGYSQSYELCDAALQSSGSADKKLLADAHQCRGFALICRASLSDTSAVSGSKEFALGVKDVREAEALDPADKERPAARALAELPALQKGTAVQWALAAGYKYAGISFPTVPLSCSDLQSYLAAAVNPHKDYVEADSQYCQKS